MTRSESKAILIVVCIMYVVTVIIGYIALVDLSSNVKENKDRLDYLTDKVYDTAAKVSVNERDIRIMRTDVDIHERIIVRGEYIDIQEGDIEKGVSNAKE